MLQSISLLKKEVAILWEDGAERCIPYQALRSLCPCALCGGERDVLGNQYGGVKVVPKENISIVRFERVGFYGLQFFFSDGHKDGIYTFDLLKNYMSVD